MATRTGVAIAPNRTEELSFTLRIASATEVVTVEANDSDSVAAHLAPMDALLDEHSARTEIKPIFIQNFTSPNADFGELVERAPGTFSIDPNRDRPLGQDKTYFRGFPDGDYDIDFDGVPILRPRTLPLITPGRHSFTGPLGRRRRLRPQPRIGFHHRTRALRRVESPALSRR